MSRADDGRVAGEELRRSLRQRTIKAIERARSDDHDAPKADVESLERVERLLDLHARLEPKDPPRRSWAFGIILAVTLAVVSALLFIRTSRTNIELELDVTEVAFTLPSEQVLFATLPLTSLGASGFARVTLPHVMDEEQPVGPDEDAGGGIRLTTTEAEGRRGSIAIVQLRPRSGAHVRLQLMNEAGLYRLILEHTGTPIEVGLDGPVNVERQGRVVSADLRVPRGGVFEPEDRSVALDLTFRDPANVATAQQLPIDGLSFARIEAEGERAVSVVRSMSTILEGTLHFESIGDSSRKIRPWELLRFSRASGEIRGLQLHSDRLSLSFHGVVEDLTTGDDHERRSLMPTWLDILRAQHGLELLWGTSLYLAGVAIGVHRWWKGTL